jgi:metallo-beta-lactamase class B
MRTILATLIISLSISHNLFGQGSESPLKITPLTGDFYVYTTYSTYKGSRVPANGLYLVTNDGAVIIDSPWDTTQFQPLLDSIRIRHNRKAVLCISTHFHEDRTAGLEYYKHQGIKTYTTKLTDQQSQARGMKRAEFLIDKDTVFSIGQYSFRTIYPGKGHAPDNIVIWFNKEKILYGGCLIKSTEDNTLGNLGDASIKDYATTLKNVQAKCKKPKYIIPGHNDWTNTSSLAHTLKMAQELEKKSSR